jgi:hypothetical protein
MVFTGPVSAPLICHYRKNWVVYMLASIAANTIAKLSSSPLLVPLIKLDQSKNND